MPCHSNNDLVLYESKGGIAHIRFNRPDALNALDQATAAAFLNACCRVQSATDIHVVLIEGAGRAFMAGGDLARFHVDIESAANTASQIIEPLHHGLKILVSLPQLVVASLHGAVAGAGVGVALACDIAIAADNTQFNLAYARIGISPDAGASWSLPHIVGIRKAMELIVLADTIAAAEALRLGIVNRVVPLKDLAQETATLAQRLAAGPSVAYAESKRLIRASFAASYEEHLDAEHAAFCGCARTTDFAEGMSAFFGKRRPNFQGH